VENKADNGIHREFIQLIQCDTICSDYLLTGTTYSSTVAIPEEVKTPF